MYKTVHFMKRRAGMTHQEFVDYYESIHFKWVSTIQRGGITKYVRKYMNEALYPEGEPEWDCIMELWWKSKQARESTIEGRPEELVAITGKDEVKLFDLESMLVYAYEESETELPVTEGPPEAEQWWREDTLG
jgi:EthD domain